MAKVLSRVVNGIKENMGYLKMGMAEDRKEYAKMQRIKNTPMNMRSKADTDYANMMNKTKVRKHKFN